MKDKLKRILARMLVTFLLVFIALTLIAAVVLQELTQGSIEAIAFVVSVLVGLLGPKPLEVLVKAFKLEGQWAALFCYFVALIVGAAGLLISKQLFQWEFAWDNALAIAGILFAAATYSFHRLKSQNKI